MPSTVIVGAQWGDEGKGKVVDYYAARADYVVRFNGGNNAGHTVVVGEKTYRFHLLPSGVLRGREVVIANGVVVDPKVLLEEVAAMETAGFSVRLSISERAHVIFPFHKAQDALEERLKGALAAGTTRRGIGPCYADKAARFGATIGDLLDPEALKEKLDLLVPLKQKLFKALGEETPLDKDTIREEYMGYAERLRGHVRDTTRLLNDALQGGARVLFEGAQGTHLDIDHGIYPYGTSSNCIAGGACTGAGVSPKMIGEVIGVVKAYTSRVGQGPMPTELHGELGDHIREVGGEYGTTTGRPRRVGWLDLMLVTHAHMVNGFSRLAVTKLDVLSGIDPLKICVRYSIGGEETSQFPASVRKLAEARPVYIDLPGWPQLTRQEWRSIASRGWDALPGNAKLYLKTIEETVGVPVSLISVGPARDETIEVE
ncbi:MAG: adenylosuccinate synthase [Candidatus Bathyarchaeia archaeon]